MTMTFDFVFLKNTQGCAIPTYSPVRKAHDSLVLWNR